MSESGYLPPADTPDADVVGSGEAEGTLPASEPKGEEALPDAEAAPSPVSAPEADGAEPETAPEPPRDGDRAARIAEVTAQIGLDALPPTWADAEGDWQTVLADDPFERLFLDAGQHACITPSLVERHHALIAGFWKEVVAGLDGPGAARIRAKYGGSSQSAEVVRQRQRRVDEAFQRLKTEDRIASEAERLDRQRRTEGERRLDPTLRGMLVDGELSSLETNALFHFGRQYSLTEEETAAYIQQTLQREGFSAYGDPAGDTSVQRLRSVSWVTAERREVLDQQREAVRYAEVRPLKLEDAAITSVRSLIAYANENPEGAKRRLFDGTFGSWLSGTLGEVGLKDKADEITRQYPARQSVGTEQFVRALASTIGAEVAPRVGTDVDELSLGTLPQGMTVALPVTIRRDGPRRAWGEVETEGNLSGLTVPSAFDIDEGEVTVRVDALRVEPGDYSGTLVIHPEGGADVRVPVAYTVAPITVDIGPKKLSLGKIPFRKTRTEKLALRVSPDGGRLKGTAGLAPEHPGLSLSGEIDGGLSLLRVTADTAQFEAGEAYKGAVKLNTNAGLFEVPLSFSVQIAWARVLMWMLAFAGLFAAGLGFFRAFAGDLSRRLRDFAPDVAPFLPENPESLQLILIFGGLVLGFALLMAGARMFYRSHPKKPKDAEGKQPVEAD